MSWFCWAALPLALIGLVVVVEFFLAIFTDETEGY